MYTCKPFRPHRMVRRMDWDDRKKRMRFERVDHRLCRQ